jgi:outer membrane protein OmpA-like peptidoglycan-associated protein
MKRLYLIGAMALSVIVMMTSPVLNAQESENRDENGKVVRGPYETNQFGDNWFVGAAGGVNFFLNEDFKTSFGPSLDVNVGKWLTPSMGLRLGYQGLSAKVWADSPSVLGAQKDADKGMYQQKFGYAYIHGDILWNMTNALGGYKDTRFWSVIPYLHAGYFRSYGLNDVNYADNEIATGLGILHNLRLIDRLDLIIDMRGTFVNGRIHGADDVAFMPSVTAGLSVDLGANKFVRTATIIEALELANAEKLAVLETAALALEAANIALEEENANLAKSNAALTKENTELKKRPAGMDFTTFFENMDPAVVYFEIGQTVLSEKELAHFDFIAKNLVASADKNTKINLSVLGTADGNTGTQRRNQHLSESRAKYVYDLLTTKYNIPQDRLVIKSEVVKKAAKPALNRAVVISF